MAESNGCKLLPTRCCSPSIDSQRYDDDNYPTASSEEQKKVEESVDAFFKTTQAAVRLEEGCPQVTLYSEMKTSIADFLGKCQHPEGGFSGGPGQEAHLAPTYAAVNALSILGTEEAYKVINRKTLYSFLRRMKQPDGSFIMHEGGEADVRGAYCALSVAKLTNTFTPSLFEGTAEWVIKCQTYEGGFGGVPGMEAHGGYTFCGFAALVFPREGNAVQPEKAAGKFTFSSGRGGAFPLLHKVLFSLGNESLSMESWLFDQDALQEYILLCCQDPSGGLLDKPGKHRDYYHTCYLLSGLSVAQHFGGGILGSSRVLGDPANELITVHPLYNVGMENAVAALKYFNAQPVPEDGENS
ncbi:hypothetical protein MTO96_011189 [Rhipicephalus appendiculatus]